MSQLIFEGMNGQQLTAHILLVFNPKYSYPFLVIQPYISELVLQLPDSAAELVLLADILPALLIHLIDNLPQSANFLVFGSLQIHHLSL